MSQPRVGLISGSTRTGSVHRQLAGVLADRLAAAGTDASVVDLAEFPMPIYDGDLEAAEGPPAAAHDLTELLRTFHGLVYVTPEHNGGPSALLKNTIDWITRVDRSVFAPLLIGLAAASPGPRGGVTGLATMQRLMEHMRLEIASTQLSIPSAGEAFVVGDDGRVELARADDVSNTDTFVGTFVSRLAERASVDAVG